MYSIDDMIDFLEEMKEEGYTLDEALDEWERGQAERHRQFMEDYENDAFVQYGWYQQDMIDLRKMER